MAREGIITFDEDYEIIDLFSDQAGEGIRFFVPRVELTAESVQNIDVEVLG